MIDWTKYINQKKPSETGAKIIPITHNKKFKMYRQNKIEETSLNVNEGFEGETIEEKVRRIMNNGEPIQDSAPIIWTERSEGVKAEYNIRTDRFEQAVEMMHEVNTGKLKERQMRIAARNPAPKDEGKNPETGANTAT